MIMLALVLGAIVMAATISMLLLNFANNNYNILGSISINVGIAGLIASLIVAIMYAMFAWGWVGAQYQADIINREYNTNYTQEEIFFADNVIDKIQEIKRKRVEINGDVMRDQPDEVEK